MRERRAFAHCICYVTARFIPGGSAIREKLFPAVSELLLGNPPNTLSDSLGFIQALIVLYAYAQTVPYHASGSSSQKWMYLRIKTSAESHALQLKLHRSIEGLGAAMSSQDRRALPKHSVFKMYTYWLWLYTMSQ